jgi:uncharacterized protein YdeI (YjbR/CyaY-like superfamily)
MSEMNPKTDFFFRKSKKWKEELAKLRTIALGCELAEELKWGVPCYTLDSGNVVLIHEFKDYCAYLFFKGALLTDPKKLLIQQTKNVQSARQIRFTSVQGIVELERVLKAYIQEAIKLEKSGAVVEFKKATEFPVPTELKSRFDEIPELKTAFGDLTPGRQRGYLLYFAAAKQAKTREARIDKYTQHILAGKGLDD